MQRWVFTGKNVSDDQCARIVRALIFQGPKGIQYIDVIDWVAIRPSLYGLTRDDLVKWSRIMIEYDATFADGALIDHFQVPFMAPHCILHREYPLRIDLRLQKNGPR